MNGKVGFGIIGIGNMGAAHVQFMEELNNVELVAVCDSDPEAFQRIDMKIRGRIQCCTDINEFWHVPGLEAVLIAVPHYSHPDLAIEAMTHGKHLIVEKPIAVHKAEAERLLAAAAAHPELVKSAMFNQRMVPAHRKLKQLIDSNELGRIRRINWIITDWFRSRIYYDSGNWRATWRGEGGGVLLNQCPHQLDLMQWFFGMPNLVIARATLGKYHNIEVEDDVNAYLEYDDGKVANFITSTGESPGTNRLEIMAERGRVILEEGKILFKRNEIETSEYSRTAKLGFGLAPHWDCVVNHAADNRPGHQAVIANVAEAILNGAELVAPLEEGIHGLELGNAMLMAGLTRQPVALPLDSRKYGEMLAGLAANSKYRKPEMAGCADSSNFEKSFNGI